MSLGLPKDFFDNPRDKPKASDQKVDPEVIKIKTTISDTNQPENKNVDIDTENDEDEAMRALERDLKLLEQEVSEEMQQSGFTAPALESLPYDGFVAPTLNSLPPKFIAPILKSLSSTNQASSSTTISNGSQSQAISTQLAEIDQPDIFEPIKEPSLAQIELEKFISREQEEIEVNQEIRIRLDALKRKRHDVSLVTKKKKANLEIEPTEEMNSSDEEEEEEYNWRSQGI